MSQESLIVSQEGTSGPERALPREEETGMLKEDGKLGAGTHASPRGEDVRTNIINPPIARAAVALAPCGSVATTRDAARMWAAIVVTLLAAGRPAAANAQAQGTTPLYVPGVNYSLPSVVVTAEEIEATKKEMLANKTIDVAIRMAETGGPRVGVSLVYRLKGPGNAPVVHDYVSEVYQILEGSGTLVTGGKIVDATRRAESGVNGPGLSGKDIQGGVSKTLKKGDMVLIPAGTPHKWSEVQEFMSYTVVRVDPNRIVPLK
jgi:mannose-6-phosphate isomerase-like protein (cupin superfamily)